MVPFHYTHGGWWILFMIMIGFVILMMLACFLLRRVFGGDGFCCAGGRNVDLDDPVRTLKSRYAKGEIGREEYERMRREIREDTREGSR